MATKTKKQPACRKDVQRPLTIEERMSMKRRRTRLLDEANKLDDRLRDDEEAGRGPRFERRALEMIAVLDALPDSLRDDDPLFIGPWAEPPSDDQRAATGERIRMLRQLLQLTGAVRFELNNTLIEWLDSHKKKEN